MGEDAETGRDGREVAALRDEAEQLRTALEAASDEMTRLVEDRDRLLRRVTAQARDLQAANAAYAAAADGSEMRGAGDALAHLHAAQEQEELRVAFEEMQVLTEELEVANNSLHEANRVLDQRVAERTRELNAKNAALAESELRFRTLVEGIPQLVWRAVGHGEWTWASPQWIDFTGLGVEDSAGKGWLQALHPQDRVAAQGAWNRAQAGAPLDMEARLFHRAEDRYRHFRIRATAVQAAGGEVIEWLGTCTDVDDILQLQERRQVLVAELQHRTRNLMGVVRSLTEQTLSRSADLDDFASKFRDRMTALGRVQGLLSRLSDDDRITFDELIHSELNAAGAFSGSDRRVTLDGPAGVALRSSTVQTFALALHELATNAGKYGALHQPDARLDIRWRLEWKDDDAPPWLHVDWCERGVRMPAADAPAQGGGQGRELIERALPYQLGAQTSFVMTADGVRCSIALPVSERTRAQTPA